MGESRVKFGLIGFGAWGQFHADSIRQTEGAELVSIAARSAETCAEAAKQYPDAATFRDYRQLIKSDVDVVDIVLPTHLHHEVGMAVVNAGKHLLLEKPMALELGHCRDLIRAAEKNNRVLAIGHELRLSSLWGEVKRLVDAGVVGDPQYVLVELSRGPYRQGAEGWRYDIDRVGSWVLEEPIHFLDLARWYLESAGDPERIYAVGNSKQTGHPELQDNFSCVMNMAGGAYAVVSQTLSAFEHHQTVKLSGTQGAIWASWSGAKDRTLHPTHFLKVFDGETLEEKNLPALSGEVFELRAEIAMMVDAVRGQRFPAATGEDGMWSVGMCLAAQASMGAEGPVSLRDFMAC
jgi:myo-inositol 2-dehydrogenase/D-chiro-inositol 1-dehydrogenase